MLNPLDEYPIHQTPLPLAHPATGDSNHYDRFFFHGYGTDGELFFGAALGVYANRGIIDGAFSVQTDGTQRSVFASGRAPIDRRDTRIGPLSVEVIEPFSEIRVRLGDNEYEVTADLIFSASTAAVQEKRTTLNDGPRVMLDATRITQFGRWTGQITTTEGTIDVADSFGTRDRSWGLRPLSAQVPSAPSARPPEVFWVWIPLHLQGNCVHVALMESPAGTVAEQSGMTIPMLGEGSTSWAAEPPDDQPIHIEIDWKAGTRQPHQARVVLGAEELTLDPRSVFFLRGLGYQHPERGHGIWHGELDVSGESLDVAQLDPLEIANLHVQQVVEVSTPRNDGGVGVLETLAIGAHPARGLLGFLDGGQPSGA